MAKRAVEAAVKYPTIPEEEEGKARRLENAAGLFFRIKWSLSPASHAPRAAQVHRRHPDAAGFGRLRSRPPPLDLPFPFARPAAAPLPRGPGPRRAGPERPGA